MSLLHVNVRCFSKRAMVNQNQISKKPDGTPITLQSSLCLSKAFLDSPHIRAHTDSKKIVMQAKIIENAPAIIIKIEKSTQTIAIKIVIKVIAIKCIVMRSMSFEEVIMFF